MFDQAIGLRRLMAQTVPQRHRLGRFLGVSSGKGGVGKTNISVNLSLALAERGRKVLLFDADWGLGNVDVLLNLDVRMRLDSLWSGEDRLEDFITPVHRNFDVLTVGSALGEVATLPVYQYRKLVESLELLAQRYDYTIIDTGAGLHDGVIGVLTLLPEVLLVSTPEPTSLADAYAVLKSLATRGSTTEVALILNQCRDDMDAVRAQRALERLSEHFLQKSLRCLTYVPKDERVAEAVRSQQPFLLRTPSSPASRSVKSLAVELDAYRQQVSDVGREDENEHGPLWGRLLKAFSDFRSGRNEKGGGSVVAPLRRGFFD